MSKKEISLEYKGYYGSAEYSEKDEVFFGRILGISDRITFEGDSTKALKKDFEEAVEDYLDSCDELGKQPELSYGGMLNVRINPELHKKLAAYSAAHEQSLNSAAEEAISRYVGHS